jgi:hypothetical protein
MSDQDEEEDEEAVLDDGSVSLDEPVGDDHSILRQFGTNNGLDHRLEQQLLAELEADGLMRQSDWADMILDDLRGWFRESVIDEDLPAIARLIVVDLEQYCQSDMANFDDFSSLVWQSFDEFHGEPRLLLPCLPPEIRIIESLWGRMREKQTPFCVDVKVDESKPLPKISRRPSSYSCQTCGEKTRGHICPDVIVSKDGTVTMRKGTDASTQTEPLSTLSLLDSSTPLLEASGGRPPPHGPEHTGSRRQSQNRPLTRQALHNMELLRQGNRQEPTSGDDSDDESIEVCEV